MDILNEILKQVTNKETLGSLSKSIDATPTQIKSATEALLPSLLGSMSENAKSENGLQSLMGALTKHENADVSDVNGFFSNLDLGDATKMVGHIFGNKTTSVEKEVAATSGMKQADVGKLMTMLAPLVLGFMGNQKKTQSGFDVGSLLGMFGGGDMSSLLGGLMGGSKKEAAKTSTTTSKKVTTVKKDSGNDLLNNVTDLIGGFLKNK